MNLNYFTGNRNKHYTQYLGYFYRFYLQQVSSFLGLIGLTLFHGAFKIIVYDKNLHKVVCCTEKRSRPRSPS